MPKTETTPRRSDNDMVEDYLYSRECLLVERARHEKLHKLKLALLDIDAAISGCLIALEMK